MNHYIPERELLMGDPPLDGELLMGVSPLDGELLMGVQPHQFLPLMLLPSILYRVAPVPHTPLEKRQCIGSCIKVNNKISLPMPRKF